MNDHGLGPVSPSLRRVFEAERRAPDPAPEVAARVRARVESSVRNVGASPPPAPAGIALRWALVLTVLVVAGSALLVTQPAQPPPPPAAAPQPPPTVAPSPVPTIAEEPRLLPVAPPERRVIAPDRSGKRRVRRTSTSDLAAEDAVLEQGRRALAAGDFARALALARRHQADWPKGVLVQEREVLAIRALAALVPAEARARADRFLAAFPGSALAPRVREAVARLPRP